MRYYLAQKLFKQTYLIFKIGVKLEEILIGGCNYNQRERLCILQICPVCPILQKYYRTTDIEVGTQSGKS